MPTKQELKKYLNDIKTSLPILMIGIDNAHYAYGVSSVIKLIEDEFGLNDTGVNLEG